MIKFQARCCGIFLFVNYTFLFIYPQFAFSTAVEKFVDLEFYYKLASYSLVEIIHLRIRGNSAADALAKYAVDSYLVPFAWLTFLDLYIIFGVTNQEVVALVATTLKALPSVSKANGRLAGRKLYAGNIYYLFFNILTHISSYQHKKRCATEAAHRKTQTPIVAKQISSNQKDIPYTITDGICVFTKFIR